MHLRRLPICKFHLHPQSADCQSASLNPPRPIFRLSTSSFENDDCSQNCRIHYSNFRHWSIFTLYIDTVRFSNRTWSLTFSSWNRSIVEIQIGHATFYSATYQSARSKSNHQIGSLQICRGCGCGLRKSVSMFQTNNQKLQSISCHISYHYITYHYNQRLKKRWRRC